MRGKDNPTTRNPRSRQRQKGFALIYVALAITFVLIPMAGLAVDLGMLYNIKAHLQTAADAAAIGAGYLLHASTNLQDPAQLAAIQNTAQAYFNANYPTNYFGSSITSYSANVSSSTGGRTITVTAHANVPMLLLRVLGIQNSQVGATASSNVRYISMMILVDRSGSVVNEGASSTIQSALSEFVASPATSYLTDGVDTVGMVSFGGTWRVDYAPKTHFQTGTPSIQTAINNIPFNSNSYTNTAEGLFQAWTELYQANLPGSLNVIVLLTDGRPSAFTSNFTPAAGSTCTTNNPISGVLETTVGSTWPPPTTYATSGLVATQYVNVPESNYLPANSTGCYYASNLSNVKKDFNAIPLSVGPVDRLSLNPSYTNAAGTGIPTQSGYYLSPGTTLTNQRTERYVGFNVADNMATLIRKDTTLSPMLFVIGLNYSGHSTEPLDADWLARVANDPNYVTVGSDPSQKPAGQTVYQTGQTPGMYCNSTEATLNICFSQVTSQLLRLVQ
jgi:Flp pilus assembly protein TadG